MGNRSGAVIWYYPFTAILPALGSGRGDVGGQGLVQGSGLGLLNHMFDRAGRRFAVLQRGRDRPFKFRPQVLPPEAAQAGLAQGATGRVQIVFQPVSGVRRRFQSSSGLRTLF